MKEQTKNKIVGRLVLFGIALVLSGFLFMVDSNKFLIGIKFSFWIFISIVPFHTYLFIKNRIK
jgi:hypothetical protein